MKAGTLVRILPPPAADHYAEWGVSPVGRVGTVQADWTPTDGHGVLVQIPGDVDSLGTEQAFAGGTGFFSPESLEIVQETGAETMTAATNTTQDPTRPRLSGLLARAQEQLEWAAVLSSVWAPDGESRARLAAVQERAAANWRATAGEIAAVLGQPALPGLLEHACVSVLPGMGEAGLTHP